MSTDEQQGHPDDIQVLSSELIVIQDGADDGGPRTSQRLAQSKVCQAMGTVANLGIKALFRKNADKTS